MNILSYTPGQKVTIFLEVKDSDGYRTDSLTTPLVKNIYFPDLTDGYLTTDTMTKVTDGIYTYQFTLSRGADAIGSYFVDVVYTDPVTTDFAFAGYQIICIAPFGNYGISTA